MSIPTSVVFIFVPMGIGVLLLVFTGLRRLLLGVGIALCAVLAWTAWTLGVEQVVTLNEGLVFKLVANFDVLGRQFVITDAMRPLCKGHFGLLKKGPKMQLSLIPFVSYSIYILYPISM